VPAERVDVLLGRLQQHTEWLGIESEAEVFLDHPLLRLGDRSQSLVLRLSVDKAFGQLRIDGDPGRAPAEVYAAGPIERLLRMMGFHPVFRLVTLRQQYKVGPASIRLLHVDPLGWYCEVENADSANGQFEDELGLADFVREYASFGDLARAAAPRLDRRQAERRRAGQRSPDARGHATERRAGRERRVHDRRPSSNPG
jgi:adenylate cyclase class IV